MEYLLNPYGLGCVSTQLRGNTFSVMHSTQQKTCRAEPANPDLKVASHSSGVWCSTYRLGSRPLHHHMHASPGSPAALSQQWSKTKRTWWARLLLSRWMAIIRIGIKFQWPLPDWWIQKPKNWHLYMTNSQVLSIMHENTAHWKSHNFALAFLSNSIARRRIRRRQNAENVCLVYTFSSTVLFARFVFCRMIALAFHCIATIPT